MKQLKKINIEDNLAQMFLMCEGLYAIGTGFLLIGDNGMLTQNSVHTLLSNMMPLDTWGMLLMLSGILMIIASFQKGTAKYIIMAISGLIGGILLVLYGLASFEVVASYAVGIRYTVVGIFMLTISYLGVRTLCLERSQKNDS